MLNPFIWLRGKLSDWKFHRAFERAPIKKLGAIYVKEVMGNLYAVDIEEVQAK